VLLEELGVAPSHDLTALYTRLKAGEPLQMPRSDPSSTVPETAQVLIDHDWSEAPATGVVYGRSAEVAQLQHWLVQDSCRMVAILGMGGVGKTTLAATVVKAVAGHFERVIWRSLLNAPPFEELLRPVLQSLGSHPPTHLPVRLDDQLALLLDCLRRRRCLLVLDNLESLLQADGRGVMRPGYEDYGHLLERVAHSQHSSCLMLTSRERPRGLALWEADLPRIRALRLEGLDAAASQAILTARGLTGQQADTRALAERYSG
jgi:hypothetical protein